MPVPRFHGDKLRGRDSGEIDSNDLQQVARPPDGSKTAPVLNEHSSGAIPVTSAKPDQRDFRASAPPRAAA